jgi:NADPH:quinone reductase-like Zn-dependent oxidoreductase
VSKFQPGDDVFGESVRGHQWKNGGAFAEFVAVDEDALALKPPNLSYVEAAVVPTSGLIVHENLRGRVQPGQRVLINGAGGGAGIFAVQVAKSFGGHVTAVDAAAKLEMLRSIGADEVIDYEKEDWTRPSLKYDLLFDVIGDRSLSDSRRVLTRKGGYVLIDHERFGASGHLP